MSSFRRNASKRKNDSVNNLTKKQIKDIKQFGQLHPVDERYSIHLGFLINYERC